MRLLREMEQQRRADVVGQVADDAEAAAERGEVEGQRVTFDERELRGGESLAQRGGEVAVDLDGRDVARALDETARERQPGPDLDDALAAGSTAPTIRST